MTIQESINQKFCIAGYEKYKSIRYGIKSCKITVDAFYLLDIKEIYENILQKEVCDEAISCRCSKEKIEELIKTI